MKDSKAPGILIKGRKISVFGVKNNPEIWLIFDEPAGYSKDEQDATCKTYSYNNRLHVLTAYQKIIKAYSRSRKTRYAFPIRLRK